MMLKFLVTVLRIKLFTEFGKTEGEAIWGGDTRLRTFLGFRTLRHIKFETSKWNQVNCLKFRRELQNGDRNTV